MQFSSRGLRAALATLVAFSILITLTGCSGSATKAELGIDKAASQIKRLLGGGSSVESSTTARTTVPTGSVAGTGTAAKGGSTGTATGKPAGATGAPAAAGSPSAAPVPTQIRIRVIWWNDTVNKKPTGCEIRLGSSAFSPDISQKKDVGAVGPAVIDKPLGLVIYPDGRSGKKVVVPIQLTADMQPDSERDAIHVAVSDTEVRVLGSPVDNFDRTFPRF
jgi:hypothetical protein